MSSGSQKRKRSERASVTLPPGRFARACDSLKRAEVLARFGLCILAAFAIWGIARGWRPPFAFRPGDVPMRDVTARVEFQTVDELATTEARQLAKRKVVCVYNQDSNRLKLLRDALCERVRQVVRADSLEKLGPEVWQEFMADTNETTGDENQRKENAQKRFTALREQLADDKDLEKYKESVKNAMGFLDEHGLLDALQHDFDKIGGSTTQIRVARSGYDARPTFSVEELRIDNAAKKLESKLKETLASEALSTPTFAWLRPRLKVTLTFDEAATRMEAENAAKEVPIEMKTRRPGDILAVAGQALTVETRGLLEQEHAAFVQRLTFFQGLAYTLANLGMYAALYLLCGFYCLFRQRHRLTDTVTLTRILLSVVVTVLLCCAVPHARWETVIIPLLIFSMTMVIAYDQELALLLSTVAALVVVVSLGYGLTEFVIFVASMATAVLCLRHVRSRTKLIYVGLGTAAVTLLTAVGVGTLTGHAPGLPLLQTAAWFGFFSVVAGLLMTGLLPFIENLFDVQTELSLLELGDVAHPLLQELVRRAPGTYNHSINVASIAEAAAESIGANGLLVRVGAYFHDIGKMLKPGYFIENQGEGDNRHASLLPAMSTLVIIAHVKDGADLARQHNLPNSLIDFILQHHGTTLVEYFYHRASEQSESNPDGGEVDEHSYRYPGPKPQTKEAAVLMMADAVESAGRSLSDPTPSRIEGLVCDLAMKRLLDGQFDECSLTLQELHRVETSLIKSLSAVYHGRIKYPDQQSA